MANEVSLPVRRAGLAALKADALLTALVPAEQIYTQSPPPKPAWPFIKFGVISPIPLRASCVDGSESIFAVHSFAKPRLNGSGQVIETAEDHCARIGAFVSAALDRQRLDLDAGGHARVRWTGSNGPMIDGDEADAFHHVANFRVRVIS